MWALCPGRVIQKTGFARTEVQGDGILHSAFCIHIRRESVDVAGQQMLAGISSELKHGLFGKILNFYSSQ